MKIYKNVHIHRKCGTLYFEIFHKSKEKFIIPFIQFSFKNMQLRPSVVSLNEGHTLCGTWLMFNFGIISNINLEKEYCLLSQEDMDLLKKDKKGIRIKSE